MSDSYESDRPTVSPSAIAQFYKLQQCPMYLYHRYVDDDFAGISDVSLSPLLAATGEAFEASQLQHLLDADVYSIGTNESELTFDEHWSGEADTDIERLQTVIQELQRGDRTRPVVLYQPRVRGTIGAWPVHGDADIVIASTNGGTARSQEVAVRIAEVKSSSSVKTHHQLQAGVYSLLFESVLSGIDTNISASIISQDPEDNDLTSVVTSSGAIDLRRLPTFDLGTRENDVQLLLEEWGAFDDVLLNEGELRSTGSIPTYRIDGRCDGCSKQAKCLAHSVTNHDLSLLGFNEGVQESLKDLGVETLRDLAMLYEWPEDDYKRRAISHSSPRPRDPELVTEILRETEISNLLGRSQIAVRFLREIDPSFDEEWEQRTGRAGPWGDYLIGSGRNLPDDNPPENFDVEYPRKSLVRVYPYVQHDYVRDRVVLLAAKVTCTRYEEASDDDGLFVVTRPENLPNADDETKDREERRLLETFFEQLSDAINTVRPDFRRADYTLPEGFLHLYPYGDQQRQQLIRAVKRHPNSEAAQALRTLLGYREDIDQQVVSVLRNEFRERHAFRYPGLGVVQTAAQFYSGDSELEWEATRDSGTTPLKTVFALDFFEIAVEYEELKDRIILEFDDGLQVPSDRMGNSYPVVGRHQEVLPLEYIYATDEFDLLTPELAENDEMRDQITRYRHHTDTDSPRVTLDDIEDVVRSICNAYEHIERCIVDKDATMTKEPLELADLRENTLGVSELQSTCLEYQELEFGAERRNLESQYRDPLGQRVAAGKALPFEVTTAPVESEDDDEARNWVKGSLLRSLGGGSKDGVQPATPVSLEEGNFVVMTPLTGDDDGLLTEDVEYPDDIANSVLGHLSKVDTTTGTVRVSLNWQFNQEHEKFKPNHVGWTSMPDDDWGRQYIEDGMKFVLDPALDDFVAHRAHEALQNASQNDVHNRLVNVYDDEIADALRVETSLYDPDAIRDCCEAFDRAMPESTNIEQQSFITQLHHTVAALQGPPGTGKTAYASAPALLARAHATQSDAFAAIASAHSNTAVDEIAAAVGDAKDRLAEEGFLDDAVLMRVRSTSQSDELPDSVREYHYYDNSEELEDIFERYVLTNNAPGPLIIFTTPVTLRNLVNSVRSLIDEGVDAAEEFLRDGRAQLFDLALVDEASMMDLPLLFLVGAFLRRDKQLLLIGDHRQMEPIQKHDWDTEDRKTIEENTPSVSVLDFARFLRGDEDSDFEQLDREPPTWDHKDSVLPMDRLKTTYRLPPAMARFETELFYYHDDLTLESGAPAELLPDMRDASLPSWINVALDPKTRVTVLLHDDNVYTKDSPVEAHLAKQILDPLPVVREAPESDELTAGVVVPFRLMRQRLQGKLDLTVDTVERFQGSERDVMVLAMTSGNQGYVNKMPEFLLDANRFNVGASRMKRKLFIIVSKSIFRAVSNDPREYEQQKAWKQLYLSLIAGHSPDATTELDSDDISELGNRRVNVQIYTGYRD